MDPNKPHKQIWLLDDYWDGEPCYVWCEDPAPGLDQDPDDAIGPYIHADEIRKLVEEWRKVTDYGKHGAGVIMAQKCANELEKIYSTRRITNETIKDS